MSYERFALLLGRRVDASSLGLFRVLWGLLLLWAGLRKLSKTDNLYSPESFHFTYSLLSFAQLPPEEWMVVAEVCVLAACAAAITLGAFFRPAALLYTLIYSHIFLAEKVYYNNHFYLTILMTFLLALSDADRCYSLKSRRRRDTSEPTVPFWNLFLLRGQMVIVYFFGGVAKLNEDWLVGEPIRFWLSDEQLGPPLGWVVNQEWFAWFVSYGGLVFDLTVGFLLLHRRTFWPAAAAVVSFHLTNDRIFDIGIFPFMGIASLVIFMDPTTTRRALHWLAAKPSSSKPSRRRPRRTARPTAPSSGSTPAPAAAIALVVAWFGFQVLWPLRIHFYRENPGWSEVGQHFSWRMMLRTKDAYLKFVFEPPEAEALLERTDQLPKITPVHLKQMVKIPHFILQYAHELDRRLERLGMPDVEIRALSIVSMNGRPFQPMIDPEVDLTEASYGFFEVPPWIVPLRSDGRAGHYATSRAERARWINAALAAAGSPAVFAEGKSNAVGTGPP